MAEILNITSVTVKIGNDNGEVIEVPIATLTFPNPKVGDVVKVYKDENGFIVKKENDGTQQAIGQRRINKHLFVWVGNFLFGTLGVDRFMRGQTGLGIFKLLLTLFGWIPFLTGTLAVSIWALVDWIISMNKSYGNAFGSEDDVVFDNRGKYTR